MRKSTKIVILSSVAVALIVVVLVGYQYFKNNDLTYITLNVNPDLQLAINSKEEVVEQIALDTDAEVLLSDVELEGLKAEEAIDTLIQEMVDTGFIDEYSAENSVVVTAVSDNEEDRLAVEENVTSYVQTSLNDKEVSAVVVVRGVTTEMKAKADSYDISNGKMLLISEALSLNPELSETDLVKKSIYQIQREIKNIVKTQAKKRNQTKSQLQIIKQEKKQAKQNAANDMKESYKQQNYEALQGLSDAEKESKANGYLEAQKDSAKQIVTEVTEELKGIDVADGTSSGAAADIPGNTSGGTSNYIIIEDEVINIQSNVSGQVQKKERSSY